MAQGTVLSQVILLLTLAFVGLVSGSSISCDAGYGRPEGGVPTGELAEGTTIRLSTGLYSYLPPDFDSEGKVEGRLEIKFQPSPDEPAQWGVVNEVESAWGDEEAQVACRMIAAEQELALVSHEAVSKQNTRNGYLGAFVHDISCKGTESSLWAEDEGCDYDTYTPDPNYDSNKNVGIRCEFREIADECVMCIAGKAQEVSLSWLISFFFDRI
jgi:hypothetical protein